MSKFDRHSLDAVLRGAVLLPGDPGYDEARAVWNVRFDHRPEVIVQCRNGRDVQAAVNAAREQGLPLSVKGGGHSYAANTVGDGGLLIDLSSMKGIVVDPESRRARVEPGVKWGELDRVTQEHGLATPGGTVSTVGVAGFTLGGGIGYLARKHGMAIDNLLSADVVTAAGRLVRASADENPDLFWALRGGGGNYGVVTSFELELHEVGPQVLTGQIVHRFEDAEGILRRYRDFMTGAPDEIQCYAFVLRVPPIPEFPQESHGQIVIDLVLFHTDPKGEDDFRPLLGMGDPILELVQPQPFTAVQKGFDAGLPAGQRYDSRSHDLSDLSDEAIGTFVSQVGRLPGAFTSTYLVAGGGAMSRVDPEATAFPHRRAPFAFHIMAGWADPDQDGEVMSWAQAFHEAMAPFSTGGVYVNLLGNGEAERVRAAYGANYERLATVKRKWDPENLFRMNHNIPPVG